VKTKKDFFSDIYSWADEENVPGAHEWPLTDSQWQTLLAQYSKNENTGFDCFILFKNGEMTKRSSGCDKWSYKIYCFWKNTKPEKCLKMGHNPHRQCMLC